MPSVVQQILGVRQLLRPKPVMSWGLAAFLLGVAVAYARVGAGVHMFHGLLAILTVVLAQGVVAHGLNDAYDWITGTDMESIGKGTGGSRVIPEGKMTVKGTIAAAMVGLVGLVAIGGYFILEYGWPMVAIFFVALWSPIAYSAPPLKLGYRPFNEIVVVLPALVAVVVATDLVLTGSWSWLAIGVGYLHAMFCISWFIVSRVPDYQPDKRVGKITSVVYVGRDNAALLSSGYLALGLAVVPLLAATYSPVFLLAFAAWGAMMVGLSRMDAYDAENASDVRLNNMHFTTEHAVVLAVGLAVVGV